jgi:predicted RNA-binding Zn ribbon-like protein
VPNETPLRQRAATGQWFRGRDGAQWWFDSGSVPLDFAYTGGFDSLWEALNEPGDLAAWLNGRFPEVDGTVADRDLVDAKALRSALTRAALARSSKIELVEDDIDVINLFAATPDIPPSLAGGSRRAGRSTARVGQALSAIAREAIELFDPTRAERIRPCAAVDCGLVFYDESRSNNRRWCSMQRCGNRAKVRAHRARANSPTP